MGRNCHGKPHALTFFPSLCHNVWKTGGTERWSYQLAFRNPKNLDRLAKTSPHKGASQKDAKLNQSNCPRESRPGTLLLLKLLDLLVTSASLLGARSY